MLQQTQVERVLPKYELFLKHLPNFASLANATVQNVLSIWQGLGYNRRALFLKKTAEKVCVRHGGMLPMEIEELLQLPGIGPYTAASLRAFAWNKPEIVLETNIRRVILHCFFPDEPEIRDDAIKQVLKKVLFRDNPRLWYWALMDYGALALKNVTNPNRRSAHYSRQSRFAGSNRQLRGKILSLLLKRGPMYGRKIMLLASCELTNKERVKTALFSLERDGLLKLQGEEYSLPSS